MMEFQLIEFNPRRVARGAEGARVLVKDEHGEDLLWMTKRDIAKNMMLHGRHPELVKAYDAYGAPRPDATPGQINPASGQGMGGGV